MDTNLRQLERTRIDNPERWLRALSRCGLIEHTRLTEPNIYWEALILAGKLGPTNRAVFGMLGFYPVIKCMGGQVPVAEKFTYWFRDKWSTENQVLQEAPWGWHNNAYRKKLSRLSFYIRRVEWMYQVAKTLNRKLLPLDIWLVNRESRTVLLSSLIGESWTAN